MPRPPTLAPAALALLAPIAAAAGQTPPPAYDFSALTALAAGSLTGQNVPAPVRGFDLILLKDGQRVYHQSFGQWSRDRPANADSATKTLAGGLIMSLVDSSPGPFSLQTRLSEHIPAFSGEKSAITIAQCFSHTAGFGDSAALSNPNLTLRQAAGIIAAAPLAFPAGSAFAYGGASMHAAGAVAEIAGGQPWNDLFAARITGPLGLTLTRFILTTPANPRIAGGCESTATEFARYMEMLRRGGLHGTTRILSESAVAAMFTRQTPAGIPIANTPLENSSDYGVGVWLDQRDAAGALTGAIAAGARGFQSWIDFDDGMVGAFATDLTTSSNILNLTYLIRAAAEAAVRSTVRCPGDFNRDGATGTQDLFDFLAAYFAGTPSADINASGSATVQDIFDYLAGFFGGCA